MKTYKNWLDAYKSLKETRKKFRDEDLLIVRKIEKCPYTNQWRIITNPVMTGNMPVINNALNKNSYGRKYNFGPNNEYSR